MSEHITWTNERRKLSQLIPWDINPAQIGKNEAKRLEESLDEFGQVQTIAISPQNEIYDGHQRQAVWGASKRFGKDYEVDVRVSSRELTEQERKKLVIFLRKGTVGEFDWDLLANNFEIPDLLDWGFSEKELQLSGFDLNEPDGDDPGAQMDKAEELRQKWGVKSGQLWRLGEHRLICGDCTDRAVVERVMGGEKAEYLFTDPPYGIDYDPQFLPEIAERHNKRLSSTNKVINDDGSLDLSFLFGFEKRMIWGFPYIYDANAIGWIVWDKQPGVEHRGIVTPIEMASTTMRKGFDMVRVMWGGMYRAAGEDRQPVSTQKPMGVYQPFIEAWTKEGEIIYDPFTGSAPVLIACERLHRKCRAIEISPAYVSVALERFYVMTGIMPELVTE